MIKSAEIRLAKAMNRAESDSNTAEGVKYGCAKSEEAPSAVDSNSRINIMQTDKDDTSGSTLDRQREESVDTVSSLEYHFLI